MSSLHGRESWQAGSRGERYHRKMETDGMNTQCLPLTGVKGKKMCYNPIVHPRCTNQRKPKVNHQPSFETTDHIMMSLISSSLVLKQQMKPPTFTHPHTSHPHRAIGSEHLFHCGAKKRTGSSDVTLRGC